MYYLNGSGGLPRLSSQPVKCPHLHVFNVSLLRADLELVFLVYQLVFLESAGVVSVAPELHLIMVSAFHWLMVCVMQAGMSCVVMVALKRSQSACTIMT